MDSCISWIKLIAAFFGKNQQNETTNKGYGEADNRYGGGYGMTVYTGEQFPGNPVKGPAAVRNTEASDTVADSEDHLSK